MNAKYAVTACTAIRHCSGQTSARQETRGPAGAVRKEAYGSDRPEVASTIFVTPRLAFAAQLIEIKFVARV